ncbi:MAG: ATP-binding protein [Bacteroidaceae bacterium]|nr:ATP-binding protein [Bacteroidaceae bacterium]
MIIKRDLYLNKLIRSRHNGMIKVITGIRRCGKSYLLFNLFADYLKSQGIDDEHIVKIDLEDRRNKRLRNPDALLEYIDIHINKEGMHYVMLDEVQWVDEFEDVLNSYLKISNVDIYVTGSNSKFLSNDVITEFRGRGDEIKIAPLSFSEFFSVFEGTREEALEEYLTFGGLPKVVTMQNNEERMKYLHTLFKKTYLTDILDRYKIKNEAELEELINIMASSIGGLINPTKMANTFKSVKNVSLSANTISSYLGILQDVFILEKSMRYDIKGKKYIETPAKYYFSDLGLRNARLNFRQYEVTHLMENLIYNELRIRGQLVDVGVVVLNTKNEEGKSQRKQLEVDFVCNEGSKRCYIQSALRLPTIEKREQELRSLMNITDNFQKFVITEEPIKRYQNENGVVFMNIYEFLLNENSLKV